MYQRSVARCLTDALADTPVVLLNGPRQTGKTTLARALLASAARYVSFDDSAMLSAARNDPSGFLSGIEGPVILDEVQKVPELFPAIKMSVDHDRRPGRFLLTGSADVLLLPRISESLAGRMELITLWPLSQGELQGTVDGFVDAVFGESISAVSAESEAGPAPIVKRVLTGGFPEVVARPDRQRQRVWFSSYVTTILQRDVRDLANIEGLTAMPRLLSLLAARGAGLMNAAELSRSTGLPQTTLKRYLTILETTFLIQTLPAWSANLGKRLVKSPRLIIADTGLMAHLAGLDEGRLAQEPHLAGPLLQDFVVMELRKQIGWSRTHASMYHFRTTGGEEVDIVLEGPAGRLVGIEVKGSATVGTGDLKGLRALAEAAGDRYHRGVILYTGSETVPFGPRLHAMPVSALWKLGAREQ